MKIAALTLDSFVENARLIAGHDAFVSPTWPALEKIESSDLLLVFLHPSADGRAWLNDDHVVVVDAEHVAEADLRGTVVFVGACYGLENEAMLDALKRAGARAIIAGPGVNIGGSGGWLAAADLMAGALRSALQIGLPIGAAWAIARALVRVAQASGRAGAEDALAYRLLLFGEGVRPPSQPSPVQTTAQGKGRVAAVIAGAMGLLVMLLNALSGGPGQLTFFSSILPPPAQIEVWDKAAYRNADELDINSTVFLTDTDTLTVTDWVTPSAIIPTFPTTGILDNFDRDPEGPPPSASWMVPYWVPGDGSGLVVTGTQLAGAIDSSDNAAMWDTSVGPESEVYATVATLPQDEYNIDLFVRYTEAVTESSFYRANWYRDDTNLYGYGGSYVILTKIVSGTPTLIVTPTLLNVATGDSIGLESDGTTLTYYHKPAAGSWTAVVSGTDASLTDAGRVGVLINGTVARLDNVGGGTIDTAPDFTLTEQWDTAAISLTNWSVSEGTVITDSGVLTWTVTDAITSGYGLTKTWSVVSGTWSTSAITETLLTSETRQANLSLEHWDATIPTPTPTPTETPTVTPTPTETTTPTITPSPTPRPTFTPNPTRYVLTAVPFGTATPRPTVLCCQVTPGAHLAYMVYLPIILYQPLEFSIDPPIGGGD